MTAAEKIYNLQFTIYNEFSILKFSLLLILVTCTLLLVASPTFAQATATPSSQFQNTSYQLPVTSYQAQSPHTASLAIYNFGHAMSCILIGQSPIAPCLEYRFLGNSKELIKSIPVLSTENTNYGLVGLTLASMDIIYQTPPLHTGEFLANLGSELGLVKETHAQVGGTGTRVLSGVFFLWETSRNFAYLAMIIIFLVIGVMVMFRHKLNPQTVVSVQIALPGLIIGLILITFSYFLASLITDLSFVGTGVVSAYFQTAFGNKAIPLLNAFNTENVISIVSSFAGKLDSTSVQKTINSLIGSLSPEASSQGILQFSPQTIVKLMLSAIFYQIGNTAASATLGMVGAGLSTLAGGSAAAIVAGSGAILAPGLIVPVAVAGLGLSTLAAPVAGATLGGFAYFSPGWAASILVDILLVFVILFALLRILLALLSAYLSLLVLTIISPFVFLYSSIPGSSGTASGWIRSMLANSLTFPAILAAIYFAAFLMGPVDRENPNKGIPAFKIQANAQGSSLNVYAAETKSGEVITSKYTLPGLGQIDSSILNKGIGIMVLLSASAIPGILKQTVAKGDKLGGAFEQGLNQSVTGGRGYGTALAAGIGAYAGGVTAAHTEWVGKPIGDSTAKRLNMLLNRDKSLQQRAASPGIVRMATTSRETDLENIEQVQRQMQTKKPLHDPSISSTAVSDQNRARRQRQANSRNYRSNQLPSTVPTDVTSDPDVNENPG